MAYLLDRAPVTASVVSQFSTTQEKCQTQARVVTVCISTSEHLTYEYTAHIIVYISF